MTPFVRVVILNYNGGELTLRCLASLEKLTWPRDRLDVVVVDNASADRSPEEIASRYPDVRLIRSRRNLGFAGGNNLALTDLDTVDYVALLNNDTTVEPGWLSPLVTAIEADPTVGAACSKIVFAPRFLEVQLSGPSFVPGGKDTRRLLCRVSGIKVDGVDRWQETQFADGWWGLDLGSPDEPSFQWAGPSATLRVPVGDTLSLRLAAEGPKELQIRCNGSRSAQQVDSTPSWTHVDLLGEPFDVINNVGNRLVEGGYGGDRGYLEIDQGQFQASAEVFGWCGASVLLRCRYLEEVGIFDARLFLYYEDFDLSWRGRARGWRYLYVPDSVVRHVHAATSVEGSAVFTHFVNRNRLLVLSKNAPWPLMAQAIWRYILGTGFYARRDIVRPVLHGHRPKLTLTWRRVRAFAGYIRHVGGMLADRWSQRAGQSVPDAEIVSWTVPQ